MWRKGDKEELKRRQKMLKRKCVKDETRARLRQEGRKKWRSQGERK